MKLQGLLILPPTLKQLNTLIDSLRMGTFENGPKRTNYCKCTFIILAWTNGNDVLLFSADLNLQQKIQTIPRACCITRSFSSWLSFNIVVRTGTKCSRSLGRHFKNCNMTFFRYSKFADSFSRSWFLSSLWKSKRINIWISYAIDRMNEHKLWKCRRNIKIHNSEAVKPTL